MHGCTVFTRWHGCKEPLTTTEDWPSETALQNCAQASSSRALLECSLPGSKAARHSRWSLEMSTNTLLSRWGQFQSEAHPSSRQATSETDPLFLGSSAAIPEWRSRLPGWGSTSTASWWLFFYLRQGGSLLGSGSTRGGTSRPHDRIQSPLISDQLLQQKSCQPQVRYTGTHWNTTKKKLSSSTSKAECYKLL